MSMKITNLGLFENYKPEVQAENTPDTFIGLDGLPRGIKYARRLSDGADFYRLVHGDRPEIQAREGCLYASALPLKDGSFILSAPTPEPFFQFPGTGALVRITGYEGEDPERDIASRVWDGASDEPQPQPQVHLAEADA